ncbi:MAG TPA: nucleotidyltransferase domain-containing protein [Aggregatilineaceae bacterium]|nr:nucleotidyltransferase domain-containing protein [Aggregatilineaceae bacterium]
MSTAQTLCDTTGGPKVVSLGGTMAASVDTVLWTAPLILNALQSNLPELRRLGVRKIGLFGSYRYNTAQPDSDIDFVVALKHCSFDNYMAVNFFLEDLFNCPVDLVLEKCLIARGQEFVLADALYVNGL